MQLVHTATVAVDFPRHGSKRSNILSRQTRISLQQEATHLMYYKDFTEEQHRCQLQLIPSANL